MRAQLGLLEHLIGLWDLNERFFCVGENLLTLEIDDIYFLMGLSRRGDHVSLVRKRTRGVSTKALIQSHCIVEVKKSGRNITIVDVTDFPLKAILYTITRVVGSASCHIATKTQMLYALDCIKPRIFNWCDGILINMKERFTTCRRVQLKDFGYGSLLVSFFLERGPLYRPHDIEIDIPGRREPRMRRWVDIMSRHGGGHVYSYSLALFSWLCRQLIMIEDYTYAGTDFRNDLDLVFPPGSQWDADLGERNIFYVFEFCDFFITKCVE